MSITIHQAADLVTVGGTGTVIAVLRDLTDELEVTPEELAGLALIEDDEAVTRLVDSFIEDLSYVADWALDAVAVLEELRP